MEKSGERPYLKYVEDISKNRPGGIKGRKIKPKVVYHHANTTRSERLCVCTRNTCSSAQAVLSPMHFIYSQKKPTATCWFINKPAGHNTLQNTVSRLCNLAGLQGFYTNNSLRATAATRLYNSGVDEQLVMETTGHISLEGVRSYKRTSSEQREALSDILASNIPKIPKVNEVAISTATSKSSSHLPNTPTIKPT